MPGTGLPQRIEAVRRFNRFYTKKIGVLNQGLLHSPFSLTEVRLLYELAHQENLTASKLRKELGLDAGYLSRILSGFERRRWLDKQPSETDARQTMLRLTRRGQKVFAPLNARSSDEIRGMLKALSAAGQKQLIEAMHTIEELLGAQPEPKSPYLIRPHRPGDMGWVVHRHGVLYAQEYRWDERFEALVASIVAKFIQGYDHQKERCWIAEKDDEIIGSVFLVKQSKTVAKLRLLLVEPKARGMGVGTRLVSECIHFAKPAGYRKIRLWTNSVLTGARRLYREAGFRKVHQEAHRSFGHDLVGEIWELKL